jgi:hypothetical protein
MKRSRPTWLFDQAVSLRPTTMSTVYGPAAMAGRRSGQAMGMAHAGAFRSTAGARQCSSWKNLDGLVEGRLAIRAPPLFPFSFRLMLARHSAVA